MKTDKEIAEDLAQSLNKGKCLELEGDIYEDFRWEIAKALTKAREAGLEAAAKVCLERVKDSMLIDCPDGLPGCLVAHYAPYERPKTNRECAKAIRELIK